MLRNIITPDVVITNLESTEKEECFAELLELIVAKHPEINRKKALDSLIERENKLSTAVAKDAAIPHALVESVPRVAIALGISKQGIEFESIDPEVSERPIVHVIIEILFDGKNAELRINVLRDILELVNHPDFIEKALRAETSNELCDLINSLQ